MGVLVKANGVEGGTAVYTGEGSVPQFETWENHWPQIVVGRGAASSPATGVPAPEDAGPPAAFFITSVPGFTTPGAAILVNLKVVDAQGLPVAGASPTAAASLGTVSEITDNGDGSYTFTLQLPAGQDGPVQLTAMAGAAQGSLVLPTLANAGDLSSNNGTTPQPPRQPRASTSTSGSTMRYRLLAMDMAYSHTATSSGQASVPSEVSYTKGYPIGVLGVGLQVEGWVPGTPIGFDARVKAGRYRLTVADIAYNDTVYPAMAGLRYRHEVAPGMMAYAGAWGAVLDVPIFRYAEDNTPPLLLTKRLVGGRLGVGFIMETNFILVRAELAETFAPYPVDTHAGVGIDILVVPEIGSFIHVGAEVDQHHMTFRVGDGALADELQVRGRQATVLVGFGGSL